MLIKKLRQWFKPTAINSQYYNLSKSEYYIRCLFPFHISLFMRFWDEEPLLSSDIPIHFRKFDFLATSEDVIKQMGDPRFKHKYIIEDNNYKIYFYKQKISQRNVILQFHFINNQFFSGCYTFTKLPLGGTKSVEKAIIKKYLPDSLPLNNKVHIVDKAGNTLRVINNVNTNVFYLSGNKDIKLLLPLVSELLQNDKLNAEIAVLIEMQAVF